jgi:CheY-like chemotaxis protein
MRSTVLLVEDHAEMRKLLQTLLEREGYTVFAAVNGVEALQLLRGGVEPALILLDLMLPVMDGFTFRKEQKRDPRLSTIPTIVYSGHNEMRARAAELRAAAYLQKPIKFDMLLRLVATHCQHQPVESSLS